ncbi:MAG: hypothetical protein IIX61_09275 [Loktanella sp.]|nr:hypothetical protein [Loktanella sp.]
MGKALTVEKVDIRRATILFAQAKEMDFHLFGLSWRNGERCHARCLLDDGELSRLLASWPARLR